MLWKCSRTRGKWEGKKGYRNEKTVASSCSISFLLHSSSLPIFKYHPIIIFMDYCVVYILFFFFIYSRFVRKCPKGIYGALHRTNNSDLFSPFIFRFPTRKIERMEACAAESRARSPQANWQCALYWNSFGKTKSYFFIFFLQR